MQAHGEISMVGSQHQELQTGKALPVTYLAIMGVASHLPAGNGDGVRMDGQAGENRQMLFHTQRLSYR